MNKVDVSPQQPTARELLRAAGSGLVSALGALAAVGVLAWLVRVMRARALPLSRALEATRNMARDEEHDVLSAQHAVVGEEVHM